LAPLRRGGSTRGAGAACALRRRRRSLGPGGRRPGPPRLPPPPPPPPQVGKSSLVNSLKRTRAASVGNAPGITRGLQEVALDKTVRLIDSPGVVFRTAGGAEGGEGGRDDAARLAAAAALRNAVRVEKLADPVAPVQEILRRVTVKHLMRVYRIPKFDSDVSFLSHVARARGRLGPGGAPDLEGAARLVLGDWCGGKIPYFTAPPVRERPDDELANASLVAVAAAEFDLDAVAASERGLVLDVLPTAADAARSSAGTRGGDGGDGDGGVGWAETGTSGAVDADLRGGVDGDEDVAMSQDDVGRSGNGDGESGGGDDDDDDDDDDGEGLDALVARERGTRGGGGSEADRQNRALYNADGQINPRLRRAEKKAALKAKKKAIKGTGRRPIKGGR